MNAKKLLAQALRNPQGLRFIEACRLAEAFGFRRSRTKGSHVIFSRPGVRQFVNLQNCDGKAKAYQVRQMLKLMEELQLSLGNDEP